MSGPIKPSEVNALKTKVIPEEVFQAVNELIAKAWDGKNAQVIQNEVVELSLSKMCLNAGIGSLHRTNAFKEHWFDFESAYRAEGWKVIYDKPGFNETYDAFWWFSIKF